MIDYLFISPLGWSKHVWDKVINYGNLRIERCNYIEFIDGTVNPINKPNIDLLIENNMDILSQDGCIITSSYGTIAFLSYMYRNKIKVKNLIIIDGLDTVPGLEDLKNFIYDNKKIKFSKKAEYCDEILSEEEKTDSDLLKIVEKNLIKKEDGYYPVLSTKNIFSYMSIYSEMDTKNILLSVVSDIKNLKIFSHIDIPLDYEYISEENHLLMLTDPKKLIKSMDIY